MSRAHDLHDGIQMGGMALGLVAHRAMQVHREGRKFAVAHARSDANAVAAVDRLGDALRASRAREAALQRELATARAELAQAQAALIRLAR